MPVDDLAGRLLDTFLDANPLDASLLGIPGYDDSLPDVSDAAEARTAAMLRDVAADAVGEDRDGLDETGRQTLDFVLHTATALGDAAEVPLIEWTIGDFHGAPVAAVLTSLPKVPLDTADRRIGYLARLSALPTLLAEAATRHADGMAHGRPPVARLVRAAIAQLDLLLADPDVGGIRRSPPDTAPSVGEEIDRRVETVVRPALASYRAALADRFLPQGRDDEHPGLVWLPDGERMYAALVRLHTSTERSPDDLHATGSRIVSEVGAEFNQIGERLWGTTSLMEVFDRLRHDPALRYGDGHEMLSVARRAVARAEEAAPTWFGVLPDEPCSVEAIPPAEEASSAPAYYIPGALDGSRQGTYFVNTSKPRERFRHLAECVAFHEAVPGHHFQISIAHRQSGLPTARQVMWDTACTEGWGLYAERLADEMGLYTDDLSRLGMLSADAWRAGRLVVDTGLHHLGWSRQRAVDWMLANTPLAPLEIDSEIDRYITYPAQALSYMVGRQELTRLRRHAADALGSGFDVRDFHDLVLRAGPLPLGALRGAVERWAAGSVGDRPS